MARASLGNYEYTGLGKEVTHGVAVAKTHYTKNVEVDVGFNPSYQDIEQIDQSFFQGATILDKASTAGKFSAYANAEDAGYLLSMGLGNPTTSLVTTGVYSHVFGFNSNPVNTYTVEVSKGDYVERVSGVALDKLSITNDNAAIKIDGDAKGETCFSYATLNGAVTAGTGVTFTVDTTKNLLAGDKLVSKNDAEEITIISVVSSTTFTANLVGNKLNGDVFRLKKATATFNTLEPLKYYGKAEVKFSDTLGGLSSATPVSVQSINVDVMNGLIEDFGSGSYYAQDLTQGLRKAEGKIGLTMAQGSELQYKFNKDVYQYISFKAEGNKIGSTAHYEGLTFVAKIKFTASPVSIKSGEIIKLDMTFKVVDEASLTLKNAVASY